MNQAIFTLFLAILLYVSEPFFYAIPIDPSSPNFTKDNALPVYFIQNQGQYPNEVAFYVKTQKTTAFFTQNGVVFTTVSRDSEKDIANFFSYRLEFLSSNQTKIQGVDPQEYRVNHFIGNDPTKWHSHIPTFARISYPNLYPGIDLFYTQEKGLLKYEYVVEPGADASQIGMVYHNIESMSLDANGDLCVHTKTGTIRDRKPVAYQTKWGKKHDVPVRFVLSADASCHFEIGTYDHSLPLVIDPLQFSTFLGGSGEDCGYGIAVDSSKNVYITGKTESTGFPVTSNSYDVTHNGNSDVFITKVKSDGTGLIYSTFIGGSQDDLPRRITIDSSGNAYVTGSTGSSDFPTTYGSFDRVHNGGNTDVFVTKLSSDGSDISYSTFLGGVLEERGYGIVVDSSGNAYITGYTTSPKFPVTGDAYDPSHNGGDDVFVSKLSSDGKRLLYSTFIGNSGDDEGYDITIDSSGNMYITGSTYVSGREEDVFASKMKADGSGFYFSVRFGGTERDIAWGIALDSSNYVYVTGYTASSGFPTTSSAYDTSFNGGDCDVFVTKLKTDGSAYVYSTFLGGSGADYANDIVVNSYGNAYVVGATTSSGFPTVENSHDTSQNGSYDAFFSEFNAAGSGLIYSTFLGGSGSDSGWRVAVDSAANAYTTGYTASSNFSTTSGAYDTSYNGGGDVFVSKFKIHTVTTPGIPTGPGVATKGKSVTYSTGYSACKQTHSVQYRFSWGDGYYSSWSTATSVSHKYSTAKTYSIKAQARCSKDTNITSSWSDIKSVTVYNSHAVSTPDTPAGSDTATIGDAETYTTGNSACNQEHTVHYRFDWGDGNTSSWSSAVSASHTYASAGTYTIKAQAECSQDTTIVSSWSEGKSVVVYTEHTIATPDTPDGASTATINESETYTSNVYKCNQGHTLEYQFDWGDGTLSDWASANSASHSYGSAGARSIKVQTRCSHKTGVTSASSGAKSVTVYTEHTIVTPTTPTGSSSGFVLQNLSYDTGNSSCNQGHSVQYRFDWGDGNISSWDASSSASHAYTTSGTFTIKSQARCSFRTGVTSAWSEGKSVTIDPHTVNDPNTPTGDSNGFVLKNMTYTTSGSSCNQSHSVEYRFDWGDGSRNSRRYSDWSSSTSASHAYTTAGTYSVKAQARCKDYTPIVSEWSAGKSVTIAPHTVNTPDIPTGPDQCDVGETPAYTTGNSTCDQGHSVEYRFDWDDSTTSEWGTPSGSHTYSQAGTYTIKARARCKDYTSIVSSWSSGKSLSVLTHVVTRPDYPSGRGQADLSQAITFTGLGSECNQGHALQYRFEWGDTTTSDWSSSNSADKSYAVAGHYPVKVQTRCSVKNNVVSEWSKIKYIHVDIFMLDFDADGKTDFAVWQRFTGEWFCLNSGDSNGSYIQKKWENDGEKTWIPLPADYDGDRKTDLAIWNRKTGEWYCLKSSDDNNSYIYKQWGTNGITDWIPVPGDYDGDRKTDLAIWNKSTGEWYCLKSSDNNNSHICKQWGTGGITNWLPVPGDYDGDKITDFCVWNKSTGEWYGENSSDQSSFSVVWKQGGIKEWIPVHYDYDGDQKTDIAVWNRNTGKWYCRKSSNTTETIYKLWGKNGENEWIPVPGDYDGDGKGDLAVWNIQTGKWQVLSSLSDYNTTIGKIWRDQGNNFWIPVIQQDKSH